MIGILAAALFVDLLGGVRRAPDSQVAAAPLQPVLVSLSGGVFTMGDVARPDAVPRRVAVGPFAIGRYEVRRAEFFRFAREAGIRVHRFDDDGDDRKPVSGITWDEAVGYTQWLSQKTGRAYRLPTEAEWEFAARGGLEARAFEWGDDEPPLPVAPANVADQAAVRHYHGGARLQMFPLAASGYNDGYAGLAPIGSFAPNGYGVFEMTGNVAEWCADLYTDEHGAVSDLRVVRGGSFLSRYDYELRIGLREGLDPSIQNAGIGFRVALSSPES